MNITATQSLKLYQIGQQYFNNQEDDAEFVAAIENVVDNKFNLQKDVLATKTDISNVRKEISGSKVDTIKWIGKLFITLALMIIGLYLKK